MLKPRSTTTTEPGLTVWRLLWTHVHLLILSLFLIGVDRAAGLVWPFLSKYVVDDVILRRSRSLLIVLVVVGALATVLQGLSTYLITRVVNLYAHRLVADLRKRIHDHVLNLSIDHFDENKTGALVSRVMSDVEGVRNLLGGGFASFLGAIATAIIAFTILIRINALMTLVVLSVLIPAALFARRTLEKYRPIFTEVNVLRADLVGRMTESFGGVRVLKAYRAEAREHEVFKGGIDRLLGKVTATIKASAVLDLTLVVVLGIFGAVIAYFGGAAVMDGTMTLGDLFRYVMFMGVVVAPLIQVVGIGTQFNEAYAGLERVRDLLAQSREDWDRGRTVRAGRLQGEVGFESVTFGYRGNPDVLSDVSFRAAPGATVALVGPSGAGKSTITGLIAAFYKPRSGTIRVDGMDLSRVDLDSYRSQLGMVAQDPFLFSGSIRDNVAFGQPRAAEEEILNACRLAYVDEFACRLKDGYDTIVGERGITLSMGQRQRVAIARAILANPRILILDEATSSLDSSSEAIIQEALSILLRDRTTFVIAHRLSTIHRADQILFINGGKILERGSHESLLKAKGGYWELYAAQAESRSNLFIATGMRDGLPTGHRDSN